MATYVELQITSQFSCLRGVSAPDGLFAAAAALAHIKLGLADHNTLAEVAREWAGQKEMGACARTSRGA